MTRILEFRTRNEASAGLASDLRSILMKGLTRQIYASFVVSGGQSPAAMLRSLSVSTLNWSNITVVCSDERWVPVDHPDNNEKMIRNTLLQGAASDANFISLYRSGMSPEDACEVVNKELSQLALPFDVVVLGMGNDGHTASLFPDLPNINTLLESDNFCEVTRPRAADHRRITMTPKTLLRTRQISLLLFGAYKREVLQHAMGAGSASECPVRIVLHQSDIPVTIYWAP